MCRALLDVKVCIIADKYALPTLGGLASLAFTTNVNTAWKEPRLANVVEEIYLNAPEPASQQLKPTLLRVVADHSRSLYENDFGAGFRAAMRTIPEFAADLSELIVMGMKPKPAATPKFWYYDCDCGNSWREDKSGSISPIEECEVCGDELLPYEQG